MAEPDKEKSNLMKPALFCSKRFCQKAFGGTVASTSRPTCSSCGMGVVGGIGRLEPGTEPVTVSSLHEGAWKMERDGRGVCVCGGGGGGGTAIA